VSGDNNAICIVVARNIMLQQAGAQSTTHVAGGSPQMKPVRLLVVAFMFLGISASLGAIDLIDRPSEGRQYVTLRFRFAENLRLENPFDMESNHVELLIQQPDSSACTLSFFYDGLRNDGVEQWEARFSPSQAGMHRFSVMINGTAQSQFEIPVSENKGEKQGGLRLSGRPGAFQYESGESFRGIGLNVCWAHDFGYYFRKMRAAGITITRIWMCPWSLPFEWKETGLGRYNLESARRLDTLLQVAEANGIFVILCMDYHGIAPKGVGVFRENQWRSNPYNKTNGGPCGEAADLFSNADATKFLRRKYKYIVSRFGHSASIAAWEFFNEADLMAGKAMPVNRWHIEMAEYVKRVDVHKRLVSTSSTRDYMEKLVEAFRSPAIDFVMFHNYNSLDLAPHFTDLYELGIDYYQKPFVIAEFGVEYRGGERTWRVDSLHVGLHNGIWSGWFSETPIIPLSWWWDSYIDKHNIWSEYAILSRFASAMHVDWKRLVFTSLPPGDLPAGPGMHTSCMVRCMSSGDQCAVWLKNDDYKWSAMSEGTMPKEIGPFVQAIPGLVPGHYSIKWYDPQAGRFAEKTADGEVKGEGVLELSVPSFSRDIACLVTRNQ
jgi:hypothetical protein